MYEIKMLLCWRKAETAELRPNIFFIAFSYLKDFQPMARICRQYVTEIHQQFKLLCPARNYRSVAFINHATISIKGAVLYY